MVRFGKVHVEEHQSVYQDHMKYVHNDILKPFNIKIHRYARRVREMHELAKYLPPPSKNVECAMEDKWSFHKENFNTGDL